MSGWAYYNDNSAYCCRWLRNLIAAGLIPAGEVDERPIQEVRPDDVKGYIQCHWFAGLGGWAYATRLAAWPDDRAIWTGSCPCFAAGTMVLTESGYRPIEDLAVGDLALTHRGRWRRINALMARDGAELIRVRAQGVPDLITTREHPFLARSNRRTGHFGKKEWSDPTWVECQNLRAGDGGHYLGQVLPPANGVVRAGGFWFLIGRYLADGWRCLDTDRRVIVCSATHESDSVQRIISEAGYKASRVHSGSTDRHVINNRELFGFLAQFGDKAHGKRIPRIALELNAYNARRFVEGYLSGDGHREKAGSRTKECWRGTTVSRSLALGIALLAQRSHGVVASIRRCRMDHRTVIEGRSVNQRDFYVITIPDRNRSATVDRDHGWKLVRRIEPAGIGRVYNIGVEEDESYCADGSIVHNCQPF